MNLVVVVVFVVRSDGIERIRHSVLEEVYGRI